MKHDVYELTYEMEERFWWYVARRRIILSQVNVLIERLSLGNAGRPRLLDFGCGAGANLLALSSIVEPYGVDMSPQAVEYCLKRGLKNIRTIEADVLANGSNPFGEPFQIVTLLDVLEHIDNDVDALHSLSKWLAPGGMVMATVPAFNFLWSGEDYVSEHVRRYTARGLRNVFTEAGYDVLFSTYFNTLLFPLQVSVTLAKRLLRPRFMYETVVRPCSPSLNALLCAIFSLEERILSRVRMPIGGSILCWGQKRTACMTQRAERATTHS
jgi:SAM-dependent methyltransferase